MYHVLYVGWITSCDTGATHTGIVQSVYCMCHNERCLQNILVKDAIVQLVSRTTGKTLKCNKTATLLTVNGREEDEGDH